MNMRPSLHRLGVTPKRSKRGSRGQSLVEFTLVIPLLLIMVCGIIDFGMALRSYVSLTNATREGARFASVGNEAGAYPADCDGVSNATAVGRVCVSIEGLDLADVNDVGVSYPNGFSPGEDVQVNADYTYNYITPLGEMLDFFTAGGFPDSVDLSTSTAMRLE